MKGKNRCRILKDIRRRIAEANDIEYITTECKYKGDCRGTCPKCEAEVRYLEAELERRRSLGYKITVAGLVAGLALTPIGCTPDETADSNITSSNSSLTSVVSEYESSTTEISFDDEASVSSYVSSEETELMGEEPEESDETMVSDEENGFSEETEDMIMGDMIPEEEEVEPDIMLEDSFEEEELMGEPVDYE